MTPVRSLTDLRMITPGGSASGTILARRKVEIELLAVLLFVERLGAGMRASVCDVRRNGHAFFLHPRDRLLDADRVPDFKRSQLPAEAPAHRAIDFDYRVGNFRNSLGGVTERARKRLPEKRADAILAPRQAP